MADINLLNPEGEIVRAPSPVMGDQIDKYLEGQIGAKPAPKPQVPSIDDLLTKLQGDLSKPDKTSYDIFQERVSAPIFGTGLPFSGVAASAALGAGFGAAAGGPAGALAGAVIGIGSEVLGSAAGAAVEAATGSETLGTLGHLGTSLAVGAPTFFRKLSGIQASNRLASAAVKAEDIMPGGLESLSKAFGMQDRARAAAVRKLISGKKTIEEVEAALPETMEALRAKNVKDTIKAVQEGRAVSGRWGQAADFLPEFVATDLRNYFRNPADVHTAAKVSTGHPVPDWSDPLWSKVVATKTPELPAMPSMYQTATDLMRKGGDFVTTRILRKVIDPKTVAAGDPAAERIVYTLAAGERAYEHIVAKRGEAIGNILKGISPEDQKFLNRVWDAFQGVPLRRYIGKNKTIETNMPYILEHPPTKSASMQAATEQMMGYLQRNKPELIPAFEKLTALHADDANTLVKMGKLDPRDMIPNYLTRVRETRAVQGPIMVEGAVRGSFEVIEGEKAKFFPVDILKNYVPKEYRAYFLQPRSVTSAPENLTLADRLGVYNHAFAKLASTDPIMEQVKTLLPLVQDPKRAEYMANLINYYLKGQPGLRDATVQSATRMLKDVEYVRNLGANILSPILNTTQRLNILAHTGYGSFMRGVVPDKELMQKAISMGLIDGPIGPAELDKMTAYGPGIGKLLRQAGDKLGWMFNMSEKSNILHAFQSGYHAAIKRGMDAEAAAEYGRLVVESTQFTSAIARVPEFARGDLGSLIGQFKNFTINQLGFMYRTAKQNPAGFVRLAVSAGVLLGPDAVLPGLDLAITRQLYGEPFKIWPGLTGHLGVALAEQVGMSGIQPDDIRRLMVFLPGPAFEHAQSIASAITGMNLGAGFDFENFGQPLTPDQQASKILRSMPVAGVAADRVRRWAKLVQTGGQDRAASEMWEAFGVKESTGPLHETAPEGMGAQIGELGLRFTGLIPERVAEKRQLADLVAGESAEFRNVVSKIADYRKAGNEKEVNKLVRKFASKYPELPEIILSADAMEAAGKRQRLTSLQRAIEAAPKGVRRAFKPRLLDLEG